MKVWQYLSKSDGMYLSGVFSNQRAALLWKEKFLEKFPEFSKLYDEVILQSNHLIDPLGVDYFMNEL